MQNDTKWAESVKVQLQGTRFQGSVNDLLAAYAKRSPWKNPKKNRMDRRGRNIEYIDIPQKHKDMIEGLVAQSIKEKEEANKEKENA